MKIDESGTFIDGEFITVFLMNGKQIIAYADLDMFGDGYMRCPFEFDEDFNMTPWPFFIKEVHQKGRIYIYKENYANRYRDEWLDPILVERYEAFSGKYDIEEEVTDNEQSD